MRLLPLLTLLLTGTVLAGCSSDAYDARRNEAEVMYHVPAYPATAERHYVDDDDVTYVQPAYRVVPADDCDELVYGGDGYYYCEGD